MNTLQQLPPNINQLNTERNVNLGVDLGVDSRAHIHAHARAHALDIFSTSPTDEQSEAERVGLRAPALKQSCGYKAPYIAFRHEQGVNAFSVIQACCNHWNCPKHGIEVAKRHYGRIVNGCEQLADESEALRAIALGGIQPVRKKDGKKAGYVLLNGQITSRVGLWFITITCLGKELSEIDAFENYGKWTSKLLDACYTKARRTKRPWDYAQVTEKQKRGHPHSHLISTFAPSDLREGHRINWITNGERVRVPVKEPALRSAWFEAQLERSGLGTEYDISGVRSVKAAARYAAKYMFKDTQFSTEFPKGWKRVRYSGGFPQLPEREADGFALVTWSDWLMLAQQAAVVLTHDSEVTEIVRQHLQGSDVLISERKSAQLGRADE